MTRASLPSNNSCGVLRKARAPHVTSRSASRESGGWGDASHDARDVLVSPCRASARAQALFIELVSDFAQGALVTQFADTREGCCQLKLSGTSLG
jgi:hypothetical protein